MGFLFFSRLFSQRRLPLGLLLPRDDVLRHPPMAFFLADWVPFVDPKAVGNPGGKPRNIHPKALIAADAPLAFEDFYDALKLRFVRVHRMVAINAHAK